MVGIKAQIYYRATQITLQDVSFGRKSVVLKISYLMR